MGPGDLVGGRFVLERQIGAGAMGVVFLAVDTQERRKVALKIIKAAAGDDAPDSARRRFSQEAQALAKLKHPALVTYLAHDDAYLAMEWLEGETLAARIRRKATLTIDECIAIGERLAGGLAEAHAAGVIHRDVKPSNVLLERGRPEAAKLLDFGIARLAGATALTRTGALIGTPGFASPEQARGHGNVDARADIFALGCVLFACLTERAPFAGEDLVAIIAKTLFVPAPRVRSLRPETPAWLDDLVDWMLAKEAADRPASMNGVLDALAASAQRSPPISRTELGAKEMRIVSVVVIGPRHADAIATEEIATVVTSPTRELATTCVEHGGRVENLHDGSLVATWTTGEATDRAANAARFALSASALVADRRLALTTGRAGDDAAMGEAIDRAFALYREADAPGIWLDDASLGLLRGSFEVAGARLVAERSRTGPRLLLGKPSPFVGRKRELATLESTWNECLEDSVARVALVVGDPGRGKSRLKDELLSATSANARAVWISRGDANRENAPFRILSALLESSGARATAEGKALATGLARLETTNDEQDPARVAAAITTAWMNFVRAARAESPLVLVLEDLHWGDAPSVRAIDAMLKSLHDAPLFVLALARPSIKKKLPQLWNGRGLVEIELTEISKKAAESFVRATAPAAADADVDWAVRESGGNPLLLEELVRAVASGTRDRRPASISAIFQARLDELDSETRRVLRAASIFGESFWLGGVAKLVGDSTNVPSILTTLELMELVAAHPESRFADESELAFRHAETRDAAYSTLTDEDRALGHALAAEWLETHGETDPALLGTHWSLGRDVERAAAMHIRTAEQALLATELKLAHDFAQRAIALAPSPELVTKAIAIDARVAIIGGDFRDAAELARSALDRSTPGSASWYRALDVSILAGGKVGPIIDELGAKFADHEPTAEFADAFAETCRKASGLLLHAGRVAEAVRFADKYKSLRRDASETETALFLRGELESYLKVLEDQRDRGERTHDTHMQWSAEANMGYALYELGAVSEAENMIRHVIDECRRLSMSSTVFYAEAILAACAYERGDNDETRALGARAFDGLYGAGDTRLSVLAKAIEARAELDVGNIDAAEAAARRADEVSSRWPHAAACTHATLAHVLLAKGDLAGAREASDRAQALVDESGSIGYADAFARIVRAKVLDACGEHADARRVALSARNRLLSRAAGLSDRYRSCFLTNLKDNVETLELAKRLGV